MDTIELHLLHGFLGLPKDWDCLNEIQSPSISLIKHKIYENVKDFHGFSKDFNKRLKASSHKKSQHILIGYSLGGRLAMHALLNAPELYTGAVFISSHFGLSNEDDKKKRLNQDTKLSAAFLTRPWGELMALWNAQAVFAKDKKTLERFEKDYKRETLSEILKTWSLAKQDSLFSKLAKINKPLFFLTGANDKKFTKLYKMQRFNPHMTHFIVDNTGHRIPFESKEFPSIINNLLKNFI